MNLFEFISISSKCFKIIWNFGSSKIVIRCVLAVLHGLSWAFEVVSAQIFFDSAQQFVNGYVEFGNVINALVLMLLSILLEQIMNGADNCYGNIIELFFNGHINVKLFQRISKENPLSFEDTKILDDINKAQVGAGKLFWVGCTLIDLIFFYGTYFVFSGIYLSTLSPLLCLSIIAIFIPSVIARKVQIITFDNLENKVAAIRRHCKYYENCASDIKETRLIGANEWFKKKFTKSLKDMNQIVMKAQVKKHIISLGIDVVTAIGYGVVLYLLFSSVIRKEISVGAFAAVLASITRLFNFMSEAITERYSLAVDSSALANNYIKYVNSTITYKSDDSDCLDDKTNGVFEIVLKDVSFRYPDRNIDVLKNINLSLRSGETVALVGENGCGKTTLCKLLLGMYTPTKGYRVSKFQNQSAVFQHFCQYKITLKENIILGEPDKKERKKHIEEICNLAGIRLYDEELFPDKLNTILGRDFSGVEVSGGQWQRIAIGRGLYRNSDFIVLDEPTSAIDPIEESQLYNKFSDVCRNKTAIIVTHRIGSARIANRIFVLKDGEIIEEGSHEQLLNNNGEYSRMFYEQSKWYR